MLSELFLLEILTFFTLFFFISGINIITLWYLGGLYLIGLGILLLLDDGDIFIGFLWVIDLGVGLIFLYLFYIFLIFYIKKPSLTYQIVFFFF